MYSIFCCPFFFLYFGTIIGGLWCSKLSIILEYFLCWILGSEWWALGMNVPHHSKFQTILERLLKKEKNLLF